jgi:hypothetical protein
MSEHLMHVDLLGERIIRNVNHNYCFHGVGGVMIPMSATDTEALEVRFLADTNEISVIRHGVGFPDEGECVYSEMMGE